MISMKKALRLAGIGTGDQDGGASRRRTDRHPPRGGAAGPTHGLFSGPDRVGFPFGGILDGGTFPVRGVIEEEERAPEAGPR